ncbi:MULTISPECIES: helix-turn-helix transcriptional regulator [Rhizobium]|uniref:helix-turn-helix domain-containing protein n=1 Tax=Rhizobium sp. L51/94 TaxID=2819999 RepID=UPI001386EAE8|nr:helix-turn-helix transcriptional regulator [Rhizobium sp. L51/94]
MAHFLGSAPAAYGQCENGKTELTATPIIQIYEVLGILPDYLLFNAASDLWRDDPGQMHRCRHMRSWRSRCPA